MFKWLFAGTRIGKHSQLRGLLECGDDAVYVDGRFHGVIRSNRSVTIARSGSVTGDVHAHDVTIAGTVHGTVVAHGALQVHARAVVDGDAYYQTLRVDHGGVIKGHTTKLDGKAKPQPEPSQNAIDALAPSALELPAGKAVPALPEAQTEEAQSEETQTEQARQEGSSDAESDPQEDTRKGKVQAVSVPPVAPDEVTSGVTSQWPAMDASAGEQVLASNAKKRKAQRKKSKGKSKSGSTTIPSSKTGTELADEKKHARRESERRRGRTTNPMGAMTPPPSSVSSAIKQKEATPTPRSGVTTQAHAPEPDNQSDEPDEPMAASSA